ncbi:MAG: hypothetical protein GXP54_06125 [Deltaproteobacteria bacterium]|nr:hypothetical protein [Deltaproteobacteria bacterium]
MDLWWENWSSRPERRDEVDETDRPGLPRLAVVGVTLLACAGLTYVLPFLSDYRPWVPGEPVPLLRLFTFEDGNAAGDGGAPGIGGTGKEALTGDRARESLAAELGAALAQNLGDDSVADQAGVSVEVSVEPRELKGLVREIEDPGGVAMRPFYKALKRTAEGRAGAITRIAHWGDSTIAADDITATLRRRLQKRFGDAGHGFILTAKGYMPYRHKDVVFKSSGWKLYPIIRGQRRDGRYGYGGVSYGSWGGGRATYGTVKEGPIGTSVSRFELFYQAHKGGGDLEWKVDGGKANVLSTKAPSTEDRWKRIDVDDGPHELSIRAIGHGEVRMYGVVMERPGPGVVYDSLGIVGARAARMLNADPDHFDAQVRHRDPDLLILAFGGNEAGDRKMSSKWYEKNLTEVVQFMRRGKPGAACLLMAPLDQGEVGPRGRVRTIPVLRRIVKVQRKVAMAQGCAFFDTFSAMGGPGAMGRWYKSKPRLGWGDYRHATPAGYEVIGNLFYKALLKGFADYLERREDVEGSHVRQS